MPELVERYLGGEIDVDAFISHRITVADVNEGSGLMEAQDGIRSVIGFNEPTTGRLDHPPRRVRSRPVHR